jgi:hypothetical protein
LPSIRDFVSDEAFDSRVMGFIQRDKADEPVTNT